MAGARRAPPFPGETPMHLHDFDIDLFLRDYWQQKPLLIRNPWAQWSNPLAPEELAGLACEEGVESRLVVQADGDWKMEQGPLAEDRFASLGASPWTLLVQAVDHQVPDVAALIAPFRFIPDWRIDDVMVSYASDGGGVGPHFDQYDVFLIQGAGRRRWRIGQACDDSSPLRRHADLRLLAEFDATDEWVLEPGDILYVPPGIAHDGVAVGDDCMTYSVGFRAPARSELIEGWTDRLLEGLGEDDRYADPALARQANPGEIAPAALARLQAMVLEQLGDPVGFARWFGEYSSTRKYPEIDWAPEEAIDPASMQALVAEGAPLRRNPASRFAFVRAEDAIMLFVDGASHDCTGASAALAQQLCADDALELDPALADDEAVIALLVLLHNQGSIAFEDDEEEDDAWDD